MNPDRAAAAALSLIAASPSPFVEIEKGDNMLSWLANLRLRWKVLIAPAFLILVLIGVGAYAWHEQRASQEAVDALMVGPVRQAEVVADFVNSALTSQVQLYRLMATAANENDAKKIKGLAEDATTALQTLADKMRVLALSEFKDKSAAKDLEQLKRVADSLCQAGQERHRHGRFRFGNRVDIDDGRGAQLFGHRPAERQSVRQQQSAARRENRVQQRSDRAPDEDAHWDHGGHDRDRLHGFAADQQGHLASGGRHRQRDQAHGRGRFRNRAARASAARTRSARSPPPSKASSSRRWKRRSSRPTRPRAAGPCRRRAGAPAAAPRPNCRRASRRKRRRPPNSRRACSACWRPG